MNEILVLLVIFFSYVVQALTGFAGAMLAMPLTIRLIDLDPARITLNFMGLASSLYIVYKDHKYINKSVIKKTILWLVLGMLLSIFVYSYVDTQLLMYLYGAMIVIIAIKKMFFKKDIPLPEFIMKLLLILGGIAQGLFNSGGPLVVVYMASMTKSKEEFRATLSMIWVLLSCMFVCQNLSIITTNEITFSLIALVPLIVSVIIGSWIHHRVTQEKFMKFSYIMLLLSGLSMFI